MDLIQYDLTRPSPTDLSMPLPSINIFAYADLFSLIAIAADSISFEISRFRLRPGRTIGRRTFIRSFGRGTRSVRYRTRSARRRSYRHGYRAVYNVSRRRRRRTLDEMIRGCNSLGSQKNRKRARSTTEPWIPTTLASCPRDGGRMYEF